MTGLSAERPWEIVLAARVAREFYIKGVSKVEIAGRLGISRFRVARLLDSALEAGMVRIEIGLPGGSPGRWAIRRALLRVRAEVRLCL